MITRAERIRLGFFIVTSVAIVVGVFITLAGIKFMEESDWYLVHFQETVSGLEIGAQVKYNGVRVGQVSDIQINPKKLDQVTIKLELRKGTPVKVDTKAILVAMGITGLKFVELTEGTNTAELLPPGGTIKAGHSFLGRIEGKAEDIAVKMELAVSKINSVLSEENISRIEDILANLKGITSKSDKLLEENDEKVSDIIQDLTRISKNIDKGTASARRSAETIEEMLGDSKPKVAEILTNVNETTTTVKETAKDIAEVDGILRRLERTLADVNTKIEAVDVQQIADGVLSSVKEADATIRSVRRVVEASRENIYEAAKSLKTTMRNLEKISAELRDQPSLLLNAKPPKDRTPPDDTKRKERK